nr:hypothetical protein CFP56_41775 [Quercus suber]
MPRRYCFVRVESMNFMGERHLEKKHLALHVIKEVQIKSSEVAALLQCELGSYDRWQLPRCTIMNNNTRTYKNSFLILPISFINFLHQVQSSPKSWQRFGHMMRSSVIVNKVNLAR